MLEILLQKFKKYLYAVFIVLIAILLETMVSTAGFAFFALLYLHKTQSISNSGYVFLCVLCDVLLHYPLGTTLLGISCYVLCIDYLLSTKGYMIRWVTHCVLFVGMQILIHFVTKSMDFSLSQMILVVAGCMCMYTWTYTRTGHSLLS